MTKITVQNTEITVLSYNDKDYISLTDMANGKQSESRAADIIKNWIRTRYTIEFLGTWEMIHNPKFKVVEFDHFRMQAGLPSLTSAVDSISRRKTRNILPKRAWQPSVNMQKISLPSDLLQPWFQTMENKHPWEVIPCLSLNMQQVAVAEAVSQNGIIYQQEDHWRRPNSNTP